MAGAPTPNTGNREYSRRSEERSRPSDGDGSLSLLRVGGSQRGGVGGRREAISTALT